MRFLRTIRLALKSLLLHKLRSGLTMLGIVFGVFSVIAMLAIGEGASAQAQKQVLELGATNILVVSVEPPRGAESDSEGQRRSVLRFGLKQEDLDLIETIPTVVATLPICELNREVRYADRRFNARIVGCTSQYDEVNHLSLARGRFITDRDQRDLANVVVLAHETARTLFPLEDPIGKSIWFGNVGTRTAYRIVGVTRSRTASAAIGGSLSGQDFNKDVYLPIRTFKSYLSPSGQDIDISTGSFSARQIEYNQITVQVENREDVIPTAEVVRESINRLHKDTGDVDVVVPLELLKQADQLRMIFNIVLGAIAAISLVVGGIGIMNIMLATVTERTREIGIRRALGARRRDITTQFLTETVVLAGTGGLIGLGLGLCTPPLFTIVRSIASNWITGGAQTGGSELARMFSQMEPSVAPWSLPLAFGISVGIGIAFGLYPARAAARLDPIEALRHE